VGAEWNALSRWAPMARLGCCAWIAGVQGVCCARVRVQDEALREAVEAHNGCNWKAIAQRLPGRTDVQCLHRWQKVLKPGLVKGPWTPEVRVMGAREGRGVRGGRGTRANPNGCEVPSRWLARCAAVGASRWVAACASVGRSVGAAARAREVLGVANMVPSDSSPASCCRGECIGNSLHFSGRICIWGAVGMPRARE
jgi:hypothetical protein